MDTMKSASPMWRRSIVTRIFVVCFVCIHLPLLGLIASLSLLEGGDNAHSFFVVLGATLVGTVLCLGILWQLIAPLRRLSTEIAAFRMIGEFGEARLNKRGDDEIAVVTRAVCGLVSEIEAIGERNDVPAITDPLSGLRMGRAMLDEGEDLFRRCQEGKEPLSLIIFDLDHFRAIREEQGRAIADKTLVAVGDLLRSMTDDNSLSARMGGSIFMLLLPETGQDGALEFAQKIGDRLDSLVVDPLKRGDLSASFGVSHLSPEMTSVADLIRDGDMDLFRARETGRSRWRSAS